MIKFFKNHPFMCSIIAVSLIAVLIVTTADSRDVTAGEDVVGMAYTPVAGSVNGVINGVKGFFLNLFSATDVHAENAELKERIMQLEGDNSLLRELQLENARLKEIAAYVEENDEYELMTARISAKNPGYWFDAFIINCGRNQGVQKDMPVVTSAGLVGRITEVGGNWAKVLTIIDAQSAVSGLVERTRDTGIIRGVVQTGSATVCSMSYLPYDTDLVPGDKVLTSGLGGMFPKGLVIGEVSEVSRSAENDQRTAAITPAVNFTQLEEVMVIMKVYERVEP